MHRLRTLFKSIRGREGGAAVEFALVAPILVGVLVGIVDLGIGLYQWMEVVNSAQAGAQLAVRQGYNSAAIQNAAANASSLSSISTTPAQFCGCPSGTTITSVPCGGTCVGGAVPGTYVTVSSQAQYSMLMSYPGLDNPLTLSAQSTVRIQ